MFIIDFDDTLFNTRGKNGFSSTRVERLKKLGINEEIYLAAYREARNNKAGECVYDDRRHAYFLGKKGFNENEVLKILVETTINAGEFLLPGAINFLEDLKKLGKPMILLSLGNSEYQYTKVRACNIEKYFDRMFMVNDSKEQVLGKLLASVQSINHWFINDKVGETLVLKEKFSQLKAVLKIVDCYPLLDYKKSGLPHFRTLHEIKDYVAR